MPLSHLAAADDIGEVSQSERAYSAIRNAILNFDLQPGFPLQEIELAQRLGMSRTPIREAIRRLKSEGLIETVPYKGAYVKALSRNDVREIYETAEGLEGMAAYLAAENSDEHGIQRLSESVDAMEKAFASKDLEALVAADEAFHAALHALTNNTYLVDSLARLYEQVHRVRMLTTRAFNQNPQSVEEHRATFEAIRDHDPERAREVTQKHWRRVRADTLRIIP